ncbi:uncharacterized protein LOC112574001 isoform X2 [Pomacea canaliculata]|uniref:uncharacterized protein LOC112574001 isoform X2 n=1 Tax=Pomacea canaliculata TaxID=400727 RepID=UPI000D734B5F|nr:uncharacterized protein LOC112574001 isoform X2 [Pomacea canaliculata]
MRGSGGLRWGKKQCSFETSSGKIIVKDHIIREQVIGIAVVRGSECVTSASTSQPPERCRIFLRLTRASQQERSSGLFDDLPDLLGLMTLMTLVETRSSLRCDKLVTLRAGIDAEHTEHI